MESGASLQALMVEISIQSFGKVTPGMDMTLRIFVDDNVYEVNKNGKWHISRTQMKIFTF